MMARLLTLSAGRTAKWIVLVVVVLIYGGLASQAGKLEGAQKNESSSWLPADAESVKALDAVKRFPGGELAPAVVVFERRGGLLRPPAGPHRRGKGAHQRRGQKPHPHPKAARARGAQAGLLPQRRRRH